MGRREGILILPLCTSLDQGQEEVEGGLDSHPQWGPQGAAGLEVFT